jgi:hypothetical protein
VEAETEEGMIGINAFIDENILREESRPLSIPECVLDT